MGRNDALEDRCMTIQIRELTRQGEIPHTLPPEAFERALGLVNKLQKLRFDYMDAFEVDYYKWFPEVGGRVNQTVASFWSLAGLLNSKELKAMVKKIAKDLHLQRVTERAESWEGMIARAYFDVVTNSPDPDLSASSVAQRMEAMFGPFKKGPTPTGVGRSLSALGFTQDRDSHSRAWSMDNALAASLASRYLPSEEKERWEKRERKESRQASLDADPKNFHKIPREELQPGRCRRCNELRDLQWRDVNGVLFCDPCYRHLTGGH